MSGWTSVQARGARTRVFSVSSILGPICGLALALACNAHPTVSNTGGRAGSNVGGTGGDETGGASGAGNTDGPMFSVPDASTTPVMSNEDARTCGLQKFDLERRPAELLLVLDRSGSMNDIPAGGTDSKWTETTAALDEVIAKTETSILWGLKMFPVGLETCMSADGVDVPMKLMNATTVTSAYQTAGPNGDGTPTSEAIKRAVAYLKATPSTNQRYLVLATDGEPTCADGVDGDLRDDMAAIQAIKDAATAGYHTFVVGIATGFGADGVLTGMASAGLEPRTATPPYYPVTSRQDLLAALSIITGKISDCVFPLNPAPPSPDDVAVKIGTDRVSRDATHANGWDYVSGGNAIQVFGAACDRIKAGSSTDMVSITFGCPGVAIP